MIKHPEQKSLILSVHVLSDLFFNYTSLDCDFLFFFFYHSATGPPGQLEVKLKEHGDALMIT